MSQGIADASATPCSQDGESMVGILSISYARRRLHTSSFKILGEEYHAVACASPALRVRSSIVVINLHSITTFLLPQSKADHIAGVNPHLPQQIQKGFGAFLQVLVIWL